tara:strand:- start:271 stop:2226 length:1956 start_codon:yes stop_codon:yes gene_type:complete
MAQIKTELLTPRNFEVGDNALSYDALGNPVRVSLSGKVGNTSSSFGVINDGINDSTQSLQDFLSLGGVLFIDEGIYLIDYAGADTGGALINLVKTTHVSCHYNAKFVMECDNDAIRFIVPSNGAGLPSELIDFSWRGGFVDQSAQKNSVVVPWIAEYPPVNQGASATCDAISIRGDYNDGVIKSAINIVDIKMIDIYAGDHWEVAGGDSAIFIGAGVLNKSVTKCNFQGSRDLGVYTSSADGLTGARSKVEQNTFVNCFHGSASKRSEIPEVNNNTYKNCVRAFQVEYIEGEGAQGGKLSNNTTYSCGTTSRIQKATGTSIFGNVDIEHGALLSDGTTIEPLVGLAGIVLQGCIGVNTFSNNAQPETAAAVTAYPTEGQFLICEDLTYNAITHLNSDNILSNNTARGWRRLGASDGASNFWVNNWCPEGTAQFVSDTGTNTVEIARTVTGETYQRSVVEHKSGTYDAPILTRLANKTVGLYFALNKLGLAGNTTELSGNLIPRLDGSSDIGTGGLRVDTIHLVNSPSVTSDERLKTPLGYVNDLVLDAWSTVNWQQFKYLESVELKGDAARTHVGLGAQSVISAFESKGLNAFEYAIVRTVKWDAIEEEFDENGVLLTHASEAGERFEIAYEEALAMECALLRRIIKRLGV